MKMLILGLGLFLLTSCGARGSRGVDPAAGEPPAQEDPYREKEVPAQILNFRTSDRESMESETRLIQDMEGYQAYLDDYDIGENTAFIGSEQLEILKGIDETFFGDGALAVAVSVEPSGSNQVEGKGAWVKGEVLYLDIERTQPSIGTTDIATRHVVFIVEASDLMDVEEVEIGVRPSP